MTKGYRGGLVPNGELAGTATLEQLSSLLLRLRYKEHSSSSWDGAQIPFHIHRAHQITGIIVEHIMSQPTQWFSDGRGGEILHAWSDRTGTWEPVRQRVQPSVPSGYPPSLAPTGPSYYEQPGPSILRPTQDQGWSDQQVATISPREQRQTDLSNWLSNIRSNTNDVREDLRSEISSRLEWEGRPARKTGLRKGYVLDSLMNSTESELVANFGSAANKAATARQDPRTRMPSKKCTVDSVRVSTTSHRDEYDVDVDYILTVAGYTPYREEKIQIKKSYPFRRR